MHGLPASMTGVKLRGHSRNRTRRQRLRSLAAPGDGGCAHGACTRCGGGVWRRRGGRGGGDGGTGAGGAGGIGSIGGSGAIATFSTASTRNAGASTTARQNFRSTSAVAIVTRWGILGVGVCGVSSSGARFSPVLTGGGFFVCWAPLTATGERLIWIELLLARQSVRLTVLSAQTSTLDASIA